MFRSYFGPRTTTTTTAASSQRGSTPAQDADFDLDTGPHPYPHSPQDKSALKEWVDRQGGLAQLAYVDMGSQGPPHCPVHTVALRIEWAGFADGYKVFPPRRARTKKVAEQM